MRGTWPSMLACASPTSNNNPLGKGFGPARADCGFREPLAPRLARPGARIVATGYGRFGLGGSGVRFGLQKDPGFPEWGSDSPSLFCWPKDCDLPPGPFGPLPSSGAPGSSFSPENEHQERPWF
jgi:hypothetical protein